MATQFKRPAEIRDRSYATWKLLCRLLATKEITIEDRVLVLAAGPYEEWLFPALGFREVTLTGFSRGQRVDATALPFDAGTFDLVFIEAALHHLAKPHLCLYEMYRVSRRSVVVCETRENWFTDLLAFLGLIERYERSAVSDSGGARGGVDDTAIPNHVYRWQQGELLKVFRSLDPAVEPVWAEESSWEFYGRAGRAGRILEAVGNRLWPSSGNCFAFHLNKRLARPFPWVCGPLGTS